MKKLVMVSFILAGIFLFLGNFAFASCPVYTVPNPTWQYVGIVPHEPLPFTIDGNTYQGVLSIAHFSNGTFNTQFIYVQDVSTYNASLALFTNANTYSVTRDSNGYGNYGCTAQTGNNCGYNLGDASSFDSAPLPTLLTVILNPAAGGTVASNPLSDFSCSNNPCTGHFSGDIQITASQSNGYAFGFWDNGTTVTDNPYTLNMSSNISMTAKFFKTYIIDINNFKAQIGSTGGECVDYVKYETGITDASGQLFSGNAWTYYQTAVNAGYQTSSTIPRPGSIVVFDKSDALPNGHVGIVKSYSPADNTMVIRESNWSTTVTCSSDCQIVGEHTETIGTNAILGYIYYTP